MASRRSVIVAVFECAGLLALSGPCQNDSYEMYTEAEPEEAYCSADNRGQF